MRHDWYHSTALPGEVRRADRVDSAIKPEMRRAVPALAACLRPVLCHRGTAAPAPYAARALVQEAFRRYRALSLQGLPRPVRIDRTAAGAVAQALMHNGCSRAYAHGLRICAALASCGERRRGWLRAANCGTVK